MPPWPSTEQQQQRQSPTPASLVQQPLQPPQAQQASGQSLPQPQPQPRQQPTQQPATVQSTSPLLPLQQEQHHQPPPPQQDLLSLLLSAASTSAGAAAGLTPYLASSFVTLMDLLPQDLQAARVGGLPAVAWPHEQLLSHQTRQVLISTLVCFPTYAPAVVLSLKSHAGCHPHCCALQESRLRQLLGQGLLSGVVGVMTTALRFGPAAHGAGP